MVSMRTTALLLGLTATAHARNCPNLTWSDEFDGTELNSTNWIPQIGSGCNLGLDLCGWGNNEPQWYLAENAQVTNGTLKITAKRESAEGRDYTSARIRTINKFDVDLTKDTLIEASIKVPSGGQGLWPAFWMMPTPEVTWPEGGEIDIMEFIGREPDFAQGYMHYGNRFGDKAEKGGPLRLPEPVYEDFHTFGIIKTNNRITWLLDGYEYQSYSTDDIEPKYSWPFERTYHLILNVAAGGLWPGDPDGTSIFPSTMEVDWVRVYDLSDGASVPQITGTRLVHQDSQQVEYCVTTSADDITWSVPAGATWTETTLGCIEVNFGTKSGYVKASVPSDCNAALSIPVEVQASYGKEFAVIDATVPLGAAEGEVNYVTMDGVPTIEYTRSLELYDNFHMDIGISDPSSYLSGERKFFMDIKTTTSAPCTQILVQLEDRSQARPDNFGIGRHSRYRCYIEATRDWQRVACDFWDRPDLSVTTVDRVVVLLDASLQRDDVYYMRYLDSTVEGCTGTACELLQSNGPSTSNCRKKGKSEAGACTDGLNNNLDGYDGNLMMDCDDPACFGVDPVCGGPSGPTPAPVPAPTLAATPTPAPVTAPTVAPVPAPTLAPTPTPAPIPAPTLAPVPAPTLAPTPTSAPISAPTLAPVPAPTLAPFATPPPNPIFDGPMECALNEACVGLINNCCPTMENAFLDCCFEEGGNQYRNDFTFVGPQVEDERAIYFESTAPYFDPGTAPDGTNPVVAYERGVLEVFDFIYYETSEIPFASAYTSGNKKFLMDVFSTANECTQIMIQLDSLPLAAPANFPIGRHSRYVAYTTKKDEWERLEFVYLDQPDPSLEDTSVNAMVLFFDPGSLRADTYFFRNWDSASIGCTSDCEVASTKSCPVKFEGETGACGDGVDNDLDGFIDCEDPECGTDPACMEFMTRSSLNAKSFLRTEDMQVQGATSGGSSGSSNPYASTSNAVAVLGAAASGMLFALF